MGKEVIKITKILQKISVGLATATLLGASFATSALASEISGNGAGSWNLIVTSDSCSSTVNQSNSTHVTTIADVSASTGGNSVSGNTGGNSSVSSGDATAGLSVSVEGGSNTAEPASCCTCLEGGSSDAVISGNGTHSANVIVDVNKQKTKVSQKNKTSVLTVASVSARTGHNRLRNNTGSGSEVVTGAAEAGLEVDVTASSNSTP